MLTFLARLKLRLFERKNGRVKLKYRLIWPLRFIESIICAIFQTVIETYMKQIIRLYCVVCFSLILQFGFCQTHTLSTEKASELAIIGTSTLHEWKAVAGEVRGIPETISLDGDLLSIDALTISASVESLDGGRGPSMNSKIQKALKNSTHPEVTFVVTDPIQMNMAEQDSKGYPIQGELSIAGETQSIELWTTVEMLEDKIHISGSKDMKMTSFKIEPPSAMFGQIKTNDDITIQFDVYYISN